MEIHYGKCEIAETSLLTAGKLIAAWGDSPKVIKEAIEKAGVDADVVKDGCKY